MGGLGKGREKKKKSNLFISLKSHAEAVLKHFIVKKCYDKN